MWREKRRRNSSAFRVIVRLTITSFPGDPADITTSLQLQPTRAWPPGDPVYPRLQAKVPDRVFEQPGWVVEASCIVYGYAANPGVWFTSAQVRAIAEIGAGIDVDLYDLTDEPQPPGR